MKIYRNFDREELDVAYNAARHVGNVEHYFTEYNERSDRTRKKLGGSFDVPFGPSTAETLDIFYPGHRAGAPIHIFFHGGGYRSQDSIRPVTPY